MSPTTHGFTPDPLVPDRWHKHGTSWDRAPIPGRWHRCEPQTMELLRSTMTWINWCACGAVRMASRWHDRNSRKP